MELREPSRAQTIVRYSGTIVLTFTLAYLLLSVLPFYVNGIYLHSYQEIFGSFVDHHEYPPYAWLGAASRPAEGIAMITAGYVPYVSLLFTPLTLVPLVLKWKSFSKREVSLWTATGLVNIVSLALTWQVHGIIMVWLVD